MKMRKVISDCFVKDELYKKLHGADIIKTILPEFLKSENEIESVNMFHDFTTYFSGFHENRKNI